MSTEIKRLNQIWTAKIHRLNEIERLKRVSAGATEQLNNPALSCLERGLLVVASIAIGVKISQLEVQQ